MAKRLAAAALISLAGATMVAQPAAARTESFDVTNNKGYPIRVCFYNNSDKVRLIALKCVKVRSGGAREDVEIKDAPSKLRMQVFEDRKIVDRKMCSKEDLSNLRRIFVGPGCVRVLLQPTGDAAKERDRAPIRRWEPGDEVLINKAGDHVWHVATITRSHDQGYTYTVRMADGSFDRIDVAFVTHDQLRWGRQILIVNSSGQTPATVLGREDDWVEVVLGNQKQQRVHTANIRVRTEALDL